MQLWAAPLPGTKSTSVALILDSPAYRLKLQVSFITDGLTGPRLNHFSIGQLVEGASEARFSFVEAFTQVATASAATSTMVETFDIELDCVGQIGTNVRCNEVVVQEQVRKVDAVNLVGLTSCCRRMERMRPFRLLRVSLLRQSRL